VNTGQLALRRIVREVKEGGEGEEGYGAANQNGAKCQFVLVLYSESSDITIVRSVQVEIDTMVTIGY